MFVYPYSFPIMQHFREFRKVTCLKFRQRIPQIETENDYLRFISGKGCVISSFTIISIGWVGGLMYDHYAVNTSQMCVFRWSVRWPSEYHTCTGLKPLHEILNALGCRNEHSQPDRDNFITINLTNVSPGKLLLLVM